MNNPTLAVGRYILDKRGSHIVRAYKGANLEMDNKNLSTLHSTPSCAPLLVSHSLMMSLIVFLGSLSLLQSTTEMDIMPPSCVPLVAHLLNLLSPHFLANDSAFQHYYYLVSSSLL